MPKFVDPGLVNESGHQHAIAYIEGDKCKGAKATINVWEPKIQQPNEFSLSQLWILGRSFGQDLNSIEAGWQETHIRRHVNQLRKHSSNDVRRLSCKEMERYCG